MSAKLATSIRTVLLLTVVVAGLTAPGTLWAQQTGQQPQAPPTATPTPTPVPNETAAPAEEQPRFSSEVVVRARRVEEEAKDVPISLTVLQSAELIQKAVGDFSDLAFTAPNMLIEENGNRPGRTNVTIRGVPGRTGVYMDDVFVGDGSANNVMMLDVDRVEVLRGPQGTLFGRNSIAGTINTITSVPSTSTWLSDVLVRGGEYGDLYATANVAGPVVKDKLGLTIAVGYGARDGYEDTVGGLNVNDVEKQAARIKAYFTPTESLSLSILGDYHHDNNLTGYSDAVEDYGIFGQFYHHAADSAQPYDRVVANRNLESRTERDVYGASAKLDWNSGTTLFQSITGYRESKDENTRDGDAGPSDIISGSQPVDYRSFSQEFRLSGASTAVSWQGGLYYFKDKREFTDFNRLGPDFTVAVVPQLAPYVGNPWGIVTIGMLYSSPLLQQIFGLKPPTPYGDRSTFNQNEIESMAGYGSLTWHAAEKLDLTVGLRYTDETINAAYSQDGVDWSPLDPDIPLTPLESTDDNVSPLLSLVYIASDSTSVYGTASRGYQSGGFNLAPGSATADQRKFEPELVTNYELGLKNSMAGGRLYTTLALFMMKYQDFQRSQSQVTNEGQITTTFNTDATIEGAEFELSSRPVEGLNLTAGVGYQKSTYDDYQNAPVNTPSGVQIVDLTGEQLPFVPLWSGTASVFYGFQLADSLGMRLGSDLQYRSDYQVNDGPDPRLEVPSTTLLNAEIGIQFQGIGLELRVRGQNLLDETYITSLDFNNLAGCTSIDLSAPRTFFVELRKVFY